MNLEKPHAKPHANLTQKQKTTYEKRKWLISSSENGT